MAIVVAGLSACGGSRGQVVIDGAFGSPIDPNVPGAAGRVLAGFANRSEYLVRGTVLTQAKGVETYSDIGRYLTISVKVTAVIAQRPNTRHVAVGDTLKFGYSVLDPSQENFIQNYAELVNAGYPTPDQIPKRGADIVGFLAPSSVIDAGFEVDGFGTVAEDQLTLHGVSVSPTGITVPLTSLTDAAVTSLYAQSAPRQRSAG